MENAAGEKVFNIGFWWHNSVSAAALRWLIILFLLITSFVYLIFTKWYPSPESLGLKSYTAECSYIYAPAEITKGELLKTYEVLEIAYKSRDEFALRDRSSSLHFFSANEYRGGFIINYTSKFAHNSTEVYTFTEEVRDRPYGSHIYIHPLSVFFRGGKAYVSYEYIRDENFLWCILFGCIFIAVACFIACAIIDERLKKRWSQKAFAK